MKVEPLEAGKGMSLWMLLREVLFHASIFSRLTKVFREALTRGVVAGYPILDVKVTVFDGSYHEVDSSEAAFKIAGSLAFQDAAKHG